MHAYVDAATRVLADAEEFYHIAHLARIGDIELANTRNALDGYGRIIDALVVRKHGEDRNLMAGVVALDVERGVRLREAPALRVFQRIVERKALILHARKDVVRSAV